MVEDANEFGKRPADDEGEAPQNKRSAARVGGSGLHIFAPSSSQATDMGAVEDRYQKFIQSSLALRGAIDFEDRFQDLSSAGAYAKECERCATEFHRALPLVLGDTRVLDKDKQRLLVEMACNTEKAADAGKAINLACKHVDDFEPTAQAILLLNGIRSFANIQPDARKELLGHLSSAIDKGYLGMAHLDALNAGKVGKPAEVSEPLSALARELGPGVPASPTPKLDKLPPEILQNIILRTIETDLPKDSREGLKKVVRTFNAISLTSKYLHANADELRLSAFSAGSKEAISFASAQHGAFLAASERQLDMEDSDNFDAADPRYAKVLRDSDFATKKIFPVIKLLAETEQLTMISTFCQFHHPTDVACLLVAASEHAGDFYPKPRSEMFARLIQVLPQVAGDQDLQDRARLQLGKAELAGQLEQRHYDGLRIVELDEPGLLHDIADNIASLKQAALNSHAKVEPERPPVISTESGEHDAVTRIAQARQSLLQKVDDRSFSR